MTSYNALLDWYAFHNIINLDFLSHPAVSATSATPHPTARMDAKAKAFVNNDAENEETVQNGLQGKVGWLIGKVTFLKDALAMYHCARDPSTPVYVKAALYSALAYFVLPIDLVPDSIPVAGLVDDASVIMGALTMFSAYIKEEHYKAAMDFFPSAAGASKMC